MERKFELQNNMSKFFMIFLDFFLWIKKNKKYTPDHSNILWFYSTFFLWIKKNKKYWRQKPFGLKSRTFCSWSRKYSLTISTYVEDWGIGFSWIISQVTPQPPYLSTGRHHVTRQLPPRQPATTASSPGRELHVASPVTMDYK